MGIFNTIKVVAKSIVNTSTKETVATRRAPLPGELETLVMEEIARLIGIGLEFTAYTVTQNLRSSNPGVEINHAAVRDVIFVREGSESTTFDLSSDWHVAHRTVAGTTVRVFIPGPAPEYDDDDDDWYDDEDDDDWDDEDDLYREDDTETMNEIPFKVGDRVRATINMSYGYFYGDDDEDIGIRIGKEGEVVDVSQGTTVEVRWGDYSEYWVEADDLELVDDEDEILEANELEDDDEGIHVSEILESPRNLFLRDFVKLYFDRKVAIGKAFTAWDITQSMREDNTGAELPHGNAIRDIVHSFDVPEGWTVVWNPDMGPIGARVFTPDTPSSEGDGETDIEAHVGLVNSMMDWSVVPPSLRPKGMGDDDDLDAWMNENPDMTVQSAMNAIDRIIDALKEEVEETLDDNVKLIRELKRSADKDYDIVGISRILLFIISNMMSNPDVDKFTIDQISAGTQWDPKFIRQVIMEENRYNTYWVNWGWGFSDDALIRYRGPRHWFAENRENDPDWPYDLRAAYTQWCSYPRLGGMHPGWSKMRVSELFDIDPSVSASMMSLVWQGFSNLVEAGKPFTAYQVTLALRKERPIYHSRAGINNLQVQLALFDIPVPDGWGREIVEHDTGDHVMLYRPMNKES